MSTNLRIEQSGNGYVAFGDGWTSPIAVEGRTPTEALWRYEEAMRIQYEEGECETAKSIALEEGNANQR